MLDDMPKGQSTSLVVDADDRFGAVALPPGTELAAPKPKRTRRGRRENGVKESARGAGSSRKGRQARRPRPPPQADRYLACARAFGLRAFVSRHDFLAELSAA